MVDAKKLKKIEDCKGRLKEIVGNEGVLSLAKDGICPHYIITNPITKEQTIWFIPSEINEWFEDNYIRYNEGYFTPSHIFINFSKEEHRPKSKIPKELSKISDLYELPIKSINTPPGIYFLSKHSEIQYIGQSVNIASRILSHISEGVKDFDAVFFINCSVNELDYLESALIKYCNPPLNRTFRKNPTVNDKVTVESLFE